LQEVASAAQPLTSTESTLQSLEPMKDIRLILFVYLTKGITKDIFTLTTVNKLDAIHNSYDVEEYSNKQELHLRSSYISTG